MNIEIKPIDQRYRAGLWELPKYQSQGAAAVDLRAALDKPVSLAAGEVMVISAGIAIHINNPGYMGMIVPRSGMGTKGLLLANTVGIIDSDYTGELKMAVYHRPSKDATRLGLIGPLFGQDESFIISPGDRIAQLIFVPVTQVSMQVVDQFTAESQRGEGGFGSTGTA